MIENNDETIEWKNVNWSQVAENLKKLMEEKSVEESTENGDKK